MAQGWIRALAPAKVNLVLAVLGRRPDGFHEIDTAMLALDLADEVEVRASRGGGIALEVSGEAATPDVPAGEENLAWRAAAAALERAREIASSHREAGLEVRLVKRIPSQAGLGGGSSDAAAALLASCRALDLAPAPEWIRSALEGIGSDCVFFAEAGATGYARCRGRGERVQPWERPAPEWNIALVAPQVRARTAAVYEALSLPLRGSRKGHKVDADLLELDEAGARAALANDLERAALEAVPELRAWRALLDVRGAQHFRLSGSGASFFGLFRGAAQAGACLAEIAQQARAQGLALRGTWVARPAGHAAVLA